MQRSATYGLREGVWKHLTLHAAAQRRRHDAGPGVLYEDGVEIGRTTNLTVPPTVNAAGTNCNFLGRSQAPAHYALRGTLRNFRDLRPGVVGGRGDRAVGGAGRDGRAARTPRRSTSASRSAIVDDIASPTVGSVAALAITGPQPPTRPW